LCGKSHQVPAIDSRRIGQACVVGFDFAKLYPLVEDLSDVQDGIAGVTGVCLLGALIFDCLGAAEVK
jgi:hypothetical protein